LKKFPVSIVGSIQPDRLAEAIEGADDGMASRFLYTWPELAPYRSLADRRAPKDADALAWLKRIAGAAKKVDDPRILKLSDDAKQQLDTFMKLLHGQADGLEGLEASWAGKGQGTVVRLATVLALLAWSEEDSAEPHSTVGSDAMRNAITLWEGYFRPHAVTVFNRVGQSHKDRQARRVVRWLLQGDKQIVSRLDVRRLALGASVDVEVTDRIIERLIRGNVLRSREATGSTKGGPRLYRWDVSPLLRKTVHA
jgi:hypothetical protein